MIGAYCLVMRVRIVWCILSHHSLNLSLVVKTRNLDSCFVAILSPQSVNWTLSCSILPFCILSAFSILLHGRNFYRIGTTIQFLGFLLLLIGLAYRIRRHHTLILAHCRIGSHSQTLACLTRSKLPILVILIVNMTKSGVRLLWWLYSSKATLSQHLVLLSLLNTWSHLCTMSCVQTCRPFLSHTLIRRWEVHVL